MLDNIPTEQGTYILILRLDSPAHLRIGRLGAFDFAAGWCAYVGSAFGHGGLRGRLKHHLKPVAKPHWHIDYLRAEAVVQAVWYHASATVYEHAWAAALRTLPGAAAPAPRFGASDCRCAAHLICFASRPDFTAFCERADVALTAYALGGV